MPKPSDILISVDQRYAAQMISGEKTVELRRRPIQIAKDCRVWIYSKVPRGHVEAVGIVDSVVRASPKDIWKKYGDHTGVSGEEFRAYFSQVDTGCAIIFREVRPLVSSVSLKEIRRRLSNFQPPQFFKRLSEGDPELRLFKLALG